MQRVHARGEVRVLQHHEVFRARRRLGPLVGRPRSREVLARLGLVRRYCLVTGASLERIVLVPAPSQATADLEFMGL